MYWYISIVQCRQKESLLASINLKLISVSGTLDLWRFNTLTSLYRYEKVDFQDLYLKLALLLKIKLF